ncbi:MAG: TlpA family protein disulfide reductase [Opitutaceae bacterium]|nr:TlpA family protein disulfide reductase [Opitutaceae bacterium]
MKSHLAAAAACLSLGLVIGYSQTTADGNESRNPVSIAQRAEVLALLDAAEQGGAVDRNRLASLVATLRTDSNLPEHDRFVIASRARGLVIKETRNQSYGDRLSAYEQAAREMAGAFPSEAEPYESLLALADDQPELVAAERIARELLGSAAPEALKAGAQIILDRLAMVGKPLPYALEDGAGSLHGPETYRGKVVVLYAWTGRTKNRPTWVGGLLRQGNDQVVFIGLNFDPDRSEAIAKTGEVALGSLQIYDPKGLGGAVARQLRITRVPTIYLIDQDGILRDVHGGFDLPQKLAALLAKGGRS